MAYWLAKQREGQDSDFIQRFDPRFWTVDFPRPMIACVFTQGGNTLQFRAEFFHRDALAGIIWESADRFDHPLTGYDTDRDYSRTTLSFRWRSSGVVPLDAVHGPTLTIEGRDAAGAARTWYVRLWKYAVGAPTDAVVTLPFSALREGWEADGEPVEPSAIDRLFISVAPAGYDPASRQLLPARINGSVDISQIRCDGERAMLRIGDAMVPPHQTGIATAYDDSYHLTPARLLRNALHLGYRGTFIHYVGMSHYFRLLAQPDGTLLVDPATPLNIPARNWHASLFSHAKTLGLVPILSLSFELFDAHCPAGWKQRDRQGNPALTGWVPPSTLLSPASAEAMAYLKAVTTLLSQGLVATGLPVHFQIGEPWWWVNADGRACIYDAGVAAGYPDAPDIADLAAPATPAQGAFLDWLADKLGSAVAGMRDAAMAASNQAATVYVLLFTPTLLDPERPAIARMNVGPRLAHPAFHRLQVEDYDWLTMGAEALRKAAYRQLDGQLGYPRERQQYLAGFVLDPADADTFWQRIDAGLDEAIRRGVGRTFVWALPQVCRDGYVRLPFEEIAVQAFDDVLYPLALGRDSGVSPEFSTSIALTASGHERRNSQWSDARLHYDVGPGIRGQAELGVLLEFFRARRGPARGFRLADPFDFSSNGLTGMPTRLDQLIGTGDGLTATYRLRKSYGGGTEPQLRFITRPRAESVVVSVDGVATSDWVLEPGGKVVFNTAPPAGKAVRAGFLFDVPVRFAEDRLDITGATFAAGEAPSVPLIELREEVV